MKESTLKEIVVSLDNIYKELFTHDRFIFNISKPKNAKFADLSFSVRKSDREFLYPTMDVYFMNDSILSISYDDTVRCNLGISTSYPYLKNKNKEDDYFINSIINNDNLEDEILDRKLHLNVNSKYDFNIKISTILKNIKVTTTNGFIS